MKKLEASIVKRHQSVNLGPFVNLDLELVQERRKQTRKQRKENENKEKKGKDKESKGQAKKDWIK